MQRKFSDLFQKKILITVVSIGLVFIGAYGVYKSQNSPGSDSKSVPTNTDLDTEYVITMTDDGFVPSEVTIYEGQTVKFITERSKLFWPASNFHPTHTIYSQLDPLKPIPIDESWSFTFAEKGEYRFHDHLFPSALGIIYVIPPPESLLGREDVDCSVPENKSTSQCWDILIQEGWKKNGIKGGFDAISVLYETEPLFLGSSCHRYAHVVGDLAFKTFYPDRENYEDWDFPIETIACGYGFYHGLFEHLFREDRNAELAVDICESLSEKLSEQFPAFRRTCYHGIGHGFMPQSPPAEQWGNPLVMTDEALKVCDNISTVMLEVRECYQGVYNVLADWIGFRNFELEPDPENPLGICDAESNEEYKLACYYEFAMRMPNYTNYDLKLLEKKFLKKIDDDFLAALVIHSASASVIEQNMTKDDFTELILECRSLDERLHKDCLQGLAGGIVAHGEPGKEYVKAVNLCASSVLTKNEKDICYKNIFVDLSNSYPESKMKTACDYVKESEYKKQCIDKTYR